MQRLPSSERANPRLHIYPAREVAEAKQKVLEPDEGMMALADIGRSLLRGLDLGPIVPILILRGGLVLWESCRDFVSRGPMGIIVPVRIRHEDHPEIAYASLPRVSGSRYVLMDVIVASGRTASACLEAIGRHLPEEQLHIVAPFVSSLGAERLLSKFPGVHIHCIWHDEQIDHRGRMLWPGFDIGDRALGSTESHLVWAKEWAARA